MANETRSVVVKLRAEANGFVVEFNNATRASDRLGHSVDRSSNLISNMFKRIAVYSAAAGLGKLAIDAVKLEATFSRSMAEIAAQTGAPQREMDKLDKLALKLGADTVFSAQDAADAMLELAKGGLTPAQIQAGALADSLTLAAAGGLDLGDAADAVVNAMGAFHLKATQTNVAINALAGGANASSADVSDMTQALAQAGQQADSSGLSIADTTGILAAFANNGIKGSDAGTSLKTMLQNLIPQTKRQREEMAALNLSFVDSHGNFVSAEQIAGRLQKSLKGLSQSQRSYALQQIFGTDASRAANILANEGAAGIAKYIKATEDQTSAQRLAKASMSGTAGALQDLSGSIDTAKIEIGKGLAPVIQDLALKSSDLVGNGDFERWTKESVAGVQDLVRELTPLAVAGGHLAVDVFPILVSSGKAFVDVLVLGAKVATPFLKAFDALPKSAQDALVLAAGAKVLSSHLSGIPGLAGSSGRGLLIFGGNARRAGTDVEEAGTKARTARTRFSGLATTLGTTIGANAALVGGTVIIRNFGDALDTMARDAHAADGATKSIVKTFDRQGQSTKATAASIKKSLQDSNVGKYADDLHLNLDRLSKDLAKNGQAGEYVQSVMKRLGDQNGGLVNGIKNAFDTLGHPLGGYTGKEKALFASKDLKDVGNAADTARDKIAGFGREFNQTRNDIILAEAGIHKYREQLDLLPTAVVTAIATPGALKSREDVVSLARQFNLTPKQVLTIMKAKDFATKDIKAVLKYLAQADGTTATPTIKLSGAEAAKQSLRALRNLITNLPGVSIDQGKPANPTIAHADGGHVVGPGGPRDDKILSWLSNGEFVVNAKDTARHRPLLESINAGRYADGGLVGNGTGTLITMSGLIASLRALATAVTQSTAQARFDKFSNLDHSSQLDLVHQRQSISQLQHDLNETVGKGKHKHLQLQGIDREAARLELADAKHQLDTMKATNAELKKYGNLKAEQLRLDKATSAADIAGTATIGDLGSSAAVDRLLVQSIANIGDFTVMLSDLRKAGAAKWLIDQLIAAGPTKTAIRIGRQYLANTAELKGLNAAAGALGSVSALYGNVANGGTLTASQRTTLVKIDATDPSQFVGEIVRQVRHYMTTEGQGANL